MSLLHMYERKMHFMSCNAQRQTVHSNMRTEINCIPCLRSAQRVKRTFLRTFSLTVTN